MEQWGEIEKAYDWVYEDDWVDEDNTGDFTITCTDGVLDKDGNQI